MLDKHAEQKTFQLKLKQTSILEANKNSASAVHDVRVKKRFARMKSPWRKRRRSVTSKEAGDVLEKCNQSFEFIMKPKELSRPTSECCNHVSCNRSNASSETQISKKTFVKSHSSDRTVYEKQNVTPIEVIKPEGSNDKTVKLSRSKSQMKTKSKAPTKEMKDVECQCPEEKFEISDADIQCDIIDRKALVESPMSDYSGNQYYMREHTSNAGKLSANSSQVGAEDGSNPKKFRAMHPLHNARSETSTSCQCSEIMIVKRDVQSQHVREQVDATCCCCISCEFKPLSRASSSHQNHPRIVVRPSLKQQPPHPIVIKNAGSDGTKEFIPLPIPAEYEHGEAQTSDHSICLDKNTYPLFMKIICADKLKEEMIRK
ncbi:uncharacterized protein LOC114355752 [Ostrinia furnacalis]|uniref:uncharacterized protein LOC114355752 n=1 Tax=Ostrinia furnacalis TaxID=93504 RepID=UPI00104009E9|nr:uncharacterized protein LOC114355752 [Ostrinia furnacalis]